MKKEARSEFSQSDMGHSFYGHGYSHGYGHGKFLGSMPSSVPMSTSVPLPASESMSVPHREMNSQDLLPLLRNECPTCGMHFEEMSLVCPKDGTVLIEEPKIGTTLFGCYSYRSLLGAGGSGVVFKAQHQILDFPVAIKVLTHNHNALAVRRFQQEAKAACLLQHENIVYVREFGISETGHPYMVMEYLNGESLAKAIERKGSLDLIETINVFAGVCKGMSYAHRKGVVHRDLKPSNIVLVQDQHSFTPKVVDFGIAKIIEGRKDGANLTRTGEIFGSPMFMSPEQALGKSVDPRADVYAAGCVLFNALTGQPPFTADSAMEILIRHVNDKPPTLAEAAHGKPFPGQLEKVVAKALAKNPADRQPNFNQFATELSQAIHSKPVLVLTSKAPTVINTLTKAIIVMLVAGIAIGIGMAVTSQFSFQDAADKPKVVTAKPIIDTEDLTPLAELNPMSVTKTLAEEALKVPRREGYNFNLEPFTTDACVKVLVQMLGEHHADIWTLDLSKTKITNATMEILTGISVKSLFINDVPRLTGAAFLPLSRIESLEELHAASLKGLTEEDLGALSKLQRLRILDLRYAQLPTRDLSFLSQLKELTTFDVSGSTFPNRGLAQVSKLHGLHQLWLSACPINDEGIAQLRGLTGLHEIDLSSTAITRASVQTLSNNQLWKLYLDNTAIDDECLSLLQKQKSLAVLSINHCPKLTAKAIAALHQALPNCRLIADQSQI